MSGYLGGEPEFRGSPMRCTPETRVNGGPCAIRTRDQLVKSQLVEVSQAVVFKAFSHACPPKYIACLILQAAVFLTDIILIRGEIYPQLEL